MSPRTRLLSSLALLLSLAQACSFQLPQGDADAGATPRRVTKYAPAPDASTIVSGYLWDPEAYWLSVAGCGMACPIPPLVMPGIPHFEAARLEAEVFLFDPVAGSATLKSPVVAGDALTNSWAVTDVPSRSGVPYLPLVKRPPTAVLSDGGVGPNPYVTTMTLRPIDTTWSQCLSISALQASREGILDAVAQFESPNDGGAAVTVDDLLNPAKYGGVAVWWMFPPGPSSLRVPAAGVRMNASQGRALAVDWAPPGVLPPFLEQSPRGFYVAGAPTSEMGITVVLFPPGPPSPTQFTPVDPIVDAGVGRPWNFPPLPPLVIAPGMVSFGELQGLLPGPGGKPPAWLCLPQ